MGCELIDVIKCLMSFIQVKLCLGKILIVLRTNLEGMSENQYVHSNNIIFVCHFGDCGGTRAVGFGVPQLFALRRTVRNLATVASTALCDSNV